MTQLYHNVTTLHPLGLLALIVIAILVLTVDRRYAFVPLLTMGIFIPSAQRIVIVGMDFTLLRLTVLAGWLRILLRGETGSFRWTKLDKAVLAWGLVAVVTFTIQNQSVMAMANRLGYMMDTLGVYFFIRCIVRDTNDVKRTVNYLMWMAIPVFVMFLIERTTGRNLFSVFGGVPEFTRVREGRLRVQGAFAHPILAGSFWAALLPLVTYRLRLAAYSKRLALLSLVVFCMLILLSASSTPILGALIGIAVLFVYRYRHKMKWIPLVSVVTYIALDIAMQAPVWHLVSRIDLSGGSTGWHRFNLVDQAIRNVHEWAWVGTRSIGSWGVWANDITNQYVLEAVRGGLVTLLAFVAVLVIAITTVRDVVDRFEDSGRFEDARLTWALGAMMVVHIVNFIAVSYFGEIIMLQYLGLGMIASLAQRTGVLSPIVPPNSRRELPGIL